MCEGRVKETITFTSAPVSLDHFPFPIQNSLGTRGHVGNEGYSPSCLVVDECNHYVIVEVEP